MIIAPGPDDYSLTFEQSERPGRGPDYASSHMGERRRSTFETSGARDRPCKRSKPATSRRGTSAESDPPVRISIKKKPIEIDLEEEGGKKGKRGVEEDEDDDMEEVNMYVLYQYMLGYSTEMILVHCRQHPWTRI